MNSLQRQFRMSGSAMVLAAGLLLGGCAAPAESDREPPIEQQIASAKTRADHEKVAAWYEQAAAAARKQVEKHRQALADYERFPYSGLYTTHHVTPAAFAQRCQSAIRANEQAAEDDLALAKLHHDMAAEAKE